MHPAICRFSYASIYPSVYQFIFAFIHLSIYPCMHPSIDSIMNPSIHPFIHPCMKLFVQPFIHPSIHPSLSKYIHLFHFLDICIRPCFYRFINTHGFMHPPLNISLAFSTCTFIFLCQSLQLYLLTYVNNDLAR